MSASGGGADDTFKKDTWTQGEDAEFGDTGCPAILAGSQWQEVRVIRPAMESMDEENFFYDT